MSTPLVACLPRAGLQPTREPTGNDRVRRVGDDAEAHRNTTSSTVIFRATRLRPMCSSVAVLREQPAPLQVTALYLERVPDHARDERETLFRSQATPHAVRLMCG